MNDTQATRLGRLLAEARHRHGLSLRAVAAEAGIAHLWLSRVEQGVFNQPAAERITRVAEVLAIDPERINRITKGHVSGSLPGVRTYFRAKYDLSQEDIDKIEHTVNQLQRNHERRNQSNDHNSHPN